MKELEMLLRQRWILKADQKEQYYRTVSYTHLTLPTTERV